MLTCFFGCWGLKLSQASLTLSENVAHQQQEIKGFDTLLNYTRTQIDTLSNLNKLLYRELQILDTQLSISKNNEELSNLHDATVLYSTSKSLHFYVSTYANVNTMKDSSSTMRFYTYIIDVLNSQLSNKFLQKNKNYLEIGVRK